MTGVEVEPVPKTVDGRTQRQRKGAQDRLYEKNRGEVLEANPRCRVPAIAEAEGYAVFRCGGRSVLTHHRRPRGRQGSHAHVNLLAACDSCHVWIHQNPDIARFLGLLVSEGDPEWDALGRSAS